jgi:hypothetical protein
LLLEVEALTGIVRSDGDLNRVQLYFGRHDGNRVRCRLNLQAAVDCCGCRMAPDFSRQT